MPCPQSKVEIISRAVNVFTEKKDEAHFLRYLC
jgi:hypothetical protein